MAGLGEFNLGENKRLELLEGTSSIAIDDALLDDELCDKFTNAELKEDATLCTIASGDTPWTLSASLILEQRHRRTTALGPRKDTMPLMTLRAGSFVERSLHAIAEQTD